MLHKGRGMGPSVESAGNAGACAPRTGQVAGVGAAKINYHGMKPANYRRLGTAGGRYGKICVAQHGCRSRRQFDAETD